MAFDSNIKLNPVFVPSVNILLRKIIGNLFAYIMYILNASNKKIIKIHSLAPINIVINAIVKSKHLDFQIL
jgi:hypothetical protein